MTVRPASKPVTEFREAFSDYSEALTHNLAVNIKHTTSMRTDNFHIGNVRCRCRGHPRGSLLRGAWHGAWEPRLQTAPQEPKSCRWHERHRQPRTRHNEESWQATGTPQQTGLFCSKNQREKAQSSVSTTGRAAPLRGAHGGRRATSGGYVFDEQKKSRAGRWYTGRLRCRFWF